MSNIPEECLHWISGTTKIARIPSNTKFELNLQEQKSAHTRREPKYECIVPILALILVRAHILIIEERAHV